MSARMLHDFAPVRPLHATLRDRIALRIAARAATAPMPESRRRLPGEFVSGMVVGWASGVITALVFFALVVWWAPLGWAVQ